MINSPADGDTIASTSVQLTASVTDSNLIGVAVNGSAQSSGSVDTSVSLDYEGTNSIDIWAEDAAGNSSSETIEVIRDTEGPWVASHNVPGQAPPGRMELEFVLADDVSGVDNGVTPSVSASADAQGTSPSVSDVSMTDGVLTATVVIPAGVPADAHIRVTVSGAKDEAGNEMDAFEIYVRRTPPPAPPTITTTGSYVSPAYVKGKKEGDSRMVQWRYADGGEWTDVVQDEIGVSADTWWWTEIPLDVGGKDADLTASC